MTVDEDYVYELEPVFGQCCSEFKKVACKDDGIVYNIGDTWSPRDDYCIIVACTESPMGIQKITQITSCDTKCELGWEYIPASPESKECCGSCKSMGCVENGVVRKIGETWSSSDFCTNYLCVLENESVTFINTETRCFSELIFIDTSSIDRN